MTAAACRQPFSIVQPNRPAVKFDAAFIERRMREHQAWQEQQAAEGASEIVREVVSALDHVMRVRSLRDRPQVTK